METTWLIPAHRGHSRYTNEALDQLAEMLPGTAVYAGRAAQRRLAGTVTAAQNVGNGVHVTAEVEDWLANAIVGPGDGLEWGRD